MWSCAEYDTIDLALMDLVSGNVDAVVWIRRWRRIMPPSDQFAGKLKIVGEPFTEESTMA